MPVASSCSEAGGPAAGVQSSGTSKAMAPATAFFVAKALDAVAVESTTRAMTATIRQRAGSISRILPPGSNSAYISYVKTHRIVARLGRSCSQKDRQPQCECVKPAVDRDRKDTAPCAQVLPHAMSDADDVRLH